MSEEKTITLTPQKQLIKFEVDTSFTIKTTPNKMSLSPKGYFLLAHGKGLNLNSKIFRRLCIPQKKLKKCQFKL
jgi:hypothetical protein